MDLSNLPICDEWDYEYYADEFDAAIDTYISTDLMGHDVVAFCDTVGPDRSLRLRRCVSADTATSALVATAEAIGGHAAV